MADNTVTHNLENMDELDFTGWNRADWEGQVGGARPGDGPGGECRGSRRRCCPARRGATECAIPPPPSARRRKRREAFDPGCPVSCGRRPHPSGHCRRCDAVDPRRVLDPGRGLASWPELRSYHCRGCASWTLTSYWRPAGSISPATATWRPFAA